MTKTQSTNVDAVNSWCTKQSTNICWAYHYTVFVYVFKTNLQVHFSR